MNTKKKNSSARIMIILLNVILIVAVLATMITYISKSSGKNGVWMTMEQRVIAEDGKMLSQDLDFDITIDKTGRYTIHAVWNGAENVDVVTGIIIRDALGDIVFYCTGDIVDVYSVPIDFKKGQYNVTYTYMASQEDFIEYWNKNGLTGNVEKDKGSFSADGEWAMNYKLEITGNDQNVYSVVIALGTVLGLLGAALINTFTKTNNKIKAEYDERQALVRGKANSYGFVTIAVYFGIIALLTLVGIDIPADKFTVYLIGLELALIVSQTINILHDGYFAMNENRTLVMVILGVLSVINLLCVISNGIYGTIVEDGMLAYGSINVVTLIFTIYIFILLMIKSAKDKKQEEEE